jgi:hypothetical protein
MIGLSSRLLAPLRVWGSWSLNHAERGDYESRIKYEEALDIANPLRAHAETFEGLRVQGLVQGRTGGKRPSTGCLPIGY